MTNASNRRTRSGREALACRYLEDGKGWSAAKGGVVAAGLAVDAASTSLDRCEVLLDESPSVLFGGGAFTGVPTLGVGGFAARLGDVSRVGDSVLFLD